MGGFGSGRRYGSGREVVESCCSLDVNQLHRTGRLGPGCSPGLQWTCAGKEVARIDLWGDGHRVVLSYRFRMIGGDWEDVQESVPIVRVPCRFGGTRPYFICPGVVNGIACRRRVVKLYGPGRYFLCRHCYRLAYASQNEDDWDRALRRADKLRRRLGDDPDAVSPFPKRPKGMWQRTYYRLSNDACAAKTLAHDAFIIQAKRLLARAPRPARK